MRLRLAWLAAFVALVIPNRCEATLHYVDANGTNPVSPYVTWAAAATNIQDAINASGFADTILVTNGIYQYGGFLNSGSNRVYANNSQVILSVNGPAFTVIKGHQVPGTTNGTSAVRCVYLQKGTTLSGFTLTNGATQNFDYGGGVYCPGAVVSNCLIINNAAYDGGGGAYLGTFINCKLIGNTVSPADIGAGGGASQSTLINCLLTHNFAGYVGGAAFGCVLKNCTVVNNSAAAYSGSLDGGFADNSILYYNFSYFTNADTGGGNTFSNCCLSFLPGAGVNNFTNPPLFADMSDGDFHLIAASPCVNAGNDLFITNSTDLDGNSRIVGGIVDLGAYEFPSTIHYVKATGTNPIPPYTNWVTAATNIQDGVDAASAGDTVLVTNGIYVAGGRGWFDSGTNLVTVTNAIILQSVNGAAVTLVVGGQASGANAVRCVLLGANALLSGFTLTNGGGGIGNYPDGGGVYCQSAGAVVSNCVLTGNLARLGGGVIRGTLVDCILRQNVATETGGGAYNAALINCLVVSNSAGVGASAGNGGGVGYGSLSNCTLIGNSAGRGGGVSFSAANNCILYGNLFTPGGSASNYISTTLNFCCTVPLPAGGLGNITNDPGFVNAASGNFHLQTNSPCINSGNNLYSIAGTDLDGNPRLTAGTVDIGTYEYQSPTSVISYAWLQQYGLPVDGTADDRDSDGDGMNNYQEWIAGTIPTNPLSLLKMLSLSPTNNPSGLVVTWQSVSNRTYFLQSGATLAMPPGFMAIQSNIVGLSGTTSYTDTNAVGDGPFFYRVGVQ